MHHCWVWASLAVKPWLRMSAGTGSAKHAGPSSLLQTMAYFVPVLSGKACLNTIPVERGVGWAQGGGMRIEH